MITINMHNNTGLDYNTVWNTMMKSVAADKIVINRNFRMHNNRRDDNIISITACDPKRGRDCVIDVDLNDISVVEQVARSLKGISADDKDEDSDISIYDPVDNYVINQKGEIVG